MAEFTSPTPDWTRQPTLIGDRVVLRPFVTGDAAAMAVVLDDAELLRLTGSVESSREAAEGFAPDEGFEAWYGSRNEQDGRLDLAIVDAACGDLVGEAVLNEWDPTLRACNLRLLIGANRRDRGLGTEAVRLLTAYAIEELGLARITLSVFTFNPRARAVYLKVGYTDVKTIAGDLVFDGEPIDSVVMEMTSERWYAAR